MFRALSSALLTALLIVYPFVFIAHSSQSDDEFRRNIIGSWTEVIDGVEGLATFYEGGRYDCQMWDSVSKKPIIEHVDGAWWIDDGKLYNRIKSVSPATFPTQKMLVIDKIVNIADNVMTLIDQQGRQYTKTKVK